MDLVRNPLPSNLPALASRRFSLLGALGRPVNLLLLGVTGVIALLILHREAPLGLAIWLRGLNVIGCALLIMAGGYWLNDLYDLEIDRINRPDRAVKVEALGRRLLFQAVFGVWSVALAGTILLPWKLWLVHVAVMSALYWYARWGKRWGLAGNVTVALLTGLLPWEMLLLTGRTSYAVDWMIPLAIGFNFVRELVKDAEDRLGDGAFGVRSLVLQLMPQTWRWLLRMLWLVLLVLPLLPAIGLFIFWGEMSWAYLAVSVLGVWGPLVWGARDFADYRRLSRALKVAMGFGLIALYCL